MCFYKYVLILFFCCHCRV